MKFRTGRVEPQRRHLLVAKPLTFLNGLVKKNINIIIYFNKKKLFPYGFKFDLYPFSDMNDKGNGCVCGRWTR